MQEVDLEPVRRFTDEVQLGAQLIRVGCIERNAQAPLDGGHLPLLVQCLVHLVDNGEQAGVLRGERQHLAAQALRVIQCSALDLELLVLVQLRLRGRRLPAGGNALLRFSRDALLGGGSTFCLGGLLADQLGGLPAQLDLFLDEHVEFRSGVYLAGFFQCLLPRCQCCAAAGDLRANVLRGTRQAQFAGRYTPVEVVRRRGYGGRQLPVLGAEILDRLPLALDGRFLLARSGFGFGGTRCLLGQQALELVLRFAELLLDALGFSLQRLEAGNARRGAFQLGQCGVELFLLRPQFRGGASLLFRYGTELLQCAFRLLQRTQGFIESRLGFVPCPDSQGNVCLLAVSHQSFSESGF